MSHEIVFFRMPKIHLKTEGGDERVLCQGLGQAKSRRPIRVDHELLHVIAFHF